MSFDLSPPILLSPSLSQNSPTSVSHPSSLLRSARRCACHWAISFDAGAYAKEIAQWQAQRLADLKSEDGWLTLGGLFWLKEGDNKIGSDKSNDIVLSPGKIGAQTGAFVLKNGIVQFETPPKSRFTV